MWFAGWEASLDDLSHVVFRTLDKLLFDILILQCKLLKWTAATWNSPFDITSLQDGNQSIITYKIAGVSYSVFANQTKPNQMHFLNVTFIV